MMHDDVCSSQEFFDNDNPCRVCAIVELARKDEREQCAKAVENAYRRLQGVLKRGGVRVDNPAATLRTWSANSIRNRTVK